MTAAVEGWRVTYLGPDVPPDEIAHTVRAQEARLLMLSIMNPTDPSGRRCSFKKWLIVAATTQL